MGLITSIPVPPPRLLGAIVLVVALGCSSHVIAGQVPSAARLPGFATGASLAGASGADYSVECSQASNPAALAFSHSTQSCLGYWRIATTDVSGATAMVVVPMGTRFGMAILARQQKVEKILDDPALADEPGLTVADYDVRLSGGASLFGRKAGIGGSVGYLSSVVFGTHGRGITTSIGGLARVTSRLSVGFDWTDMMGSFTWTTPDAQQRKSPLGPALAFSSSWRVSTGASASRIDLAYARPLEEDGEASVVRAGASLRVSPALSLAAGMSRHLSRSGDEAMAVSAGLGVNVRRFRCDLAQSSIGSAVGETLLASCSFRPSER
jgi:hypothetical protein